LIDGEPTKQHHRNINSRQCLGLDVGKCLVDHSMRRKGVVAENPRFTGSGSHERAREISTIELAGTI
jgi:hypothetical protein